MAQDIEPLGVRGDSPGNAVRYWGVTQDEYYARADVWPLDPKGELMCGLMIESVKGIKNLPQIIKEVPGISVIISDFLTESDLGSVLGALRSGRQQVVLLQVLAPQELDPDVTGDVALTDVETKASVDVTVTPALLQSYHEALDGHTNRLMALAGAHRALWHRIRSDAPVDLLVIDTFRRIGLLA